MRFLFFVFCFLFFWFFLYKGTQARIEWVLQKNFVVFHWIDPPKNSQNFLEKAHYPDATPLKISIRTHSIPAWIVTPISYLSFNFDRKSTYKIVVSCTDPNQILHLINPRSAWLTACIISINTYMSYPIISLITISSQAGIEWVLIEIFSGVASE